MSSHPRVYAYHRWSRITEIKISNFHKLEKLDLQITCWYHCFSLYQQRCFLKCFL